MRERLVPWLAALVTLGAALGAGSRRLGSALARDAWPWTRAAGRGLAHATGWLTDREATLLQAGTRTALQATGVVTAAVATGVTAIARRLVPGLASAERWAVPRLQRAGIAGARAGRRGSVLAADAGVRAARGTWRATRANAPTAWRWGAPRLVATARATGRGVAATGRLLAAALAGLGRALPTVARRGGTSLAGLVALGAGLYFLSGPALQLFALPVDVSDADGSLPALDERSAVRAADGSTLAFLHTEDRRVVPLDQVPAPIREAVLTAEDRRFAEHDGYDLEALARAALANLEAGEVRQGGSTITQQLAKQHYVGADRTFGRKARELRYAVALEREFSKDELLEHYLNSVYFGSGAYGIAAAAEEFFGTQPEQLAVEQAALLAGLIRSPGSLDPREEPERAQGRRDAVLATMASNGLLDADEAAAAAARPVELVAPGARSAPITEPHVVEAIKREFRANPAFGATPEAREELLLTGGLEVTATVDPGAQQAAATAVAAHLGDGPAGAIAAVDPSTGAVRALYTGTEFAESQFDLAAQGRRQPGSAFKPFVAAAALEAGMSPWQTLIGSGPVTFAVGDGWTVSNFQGRNRGDVTLAEAMAASVNTAFAQLAIGVGVEPIIDVAARLGINADDAFGAPETRGPAIALGGLTGGVSPLELAGAYAAFADAGRFREPYLIEQVTDAEGEVLYERSGESSAALSGAVVDELVNALSSAVEAGTGTAAQLSGWPVLGKTGTTQDSADGWFVGATPALAAAVWVGHPDGNEPIPGLTGGGPPARIWHDFAAAALADEEPRDFPRADDGTELGEDWIDLPTGNR